MNSNCRSFQPIKLAVWGSILLIACTRSISVAEVTETDMPEANLGQTAQPTYLETKNTLSPDQGENYPAQTESKPEPESQPEAPQDPLTDQPLATHEPETKDSTPSSQTDHVETLTPTEASTNLLQGVDGPGPDEHRAEVSSPSGKEQVFATAQTRMVIPTLSRDTDLTETLTKTMLIAMAKQPTRITPGIMQQNMLNLNNQTIQTEQENYLGQVQGGQLTNINLNAVNQGIDLLNKYYSGIGQALAQPIQQMLPTNPLMAGRWTDVAQVFSQNQTSQTDKFHDANTQTNNLTKSKRNNSKTQTNKINQQRIPDNDTTLLTKDKQLTSQKQHKNGPSQNDRLAFSTCQVKQNQGPAHENIIPITQLAETTQPIGKEYHTNIHIDHLGRKYIYPTDWILGQTSQLKETGGRGPGTINTAYAAKIDKGGRSYGSYQIIEANMQDYLTHSQFKNEFKDLKVNSQAFNNTWQKIAKEHPKEFWLDQHNYIQRTHYSPLIVNLKMAGIDIADRGPAIKDMIWSTAVQYGANTPVIANALRGRKVDNISNEEIIITVQDYKRKNVDRNFQRTLSNIKRVYGLKAEKKYRNSLINRTISEKNMLLKLEKQS